MAMVLIGGGLIGERRVGNGEEQQGIEYSFATSARRSRVAKLEPAALLSLEKRTPNCAPQCKQKRGGDRNGSAVSECAGLGKARRGNGDRTERKL